MARDVNRIFNQMVDDMHALAPTDDILDACMSLSEAAIRQVPLRYRIIALGFVKGFTLDELNDKLIQNGCPKLYSRNFWEATLIFAFLNGHTYDQWRQLQAQCVDLYGQMEASARFRGPKITYDELERYVQENSDEQGDMLATQLHTQYMERAIAEAGNDIEALRAFLTANLRSFSAVRERTRYYFCKYLYYYLNRRIGNYLEACRRGRGVDEALSELLALKVVTKLRRNQRMPEDEAYSVDGTRGYGRNRAGEHALHKYIQGALDIDRTVLICFLLFFASDASMPDAHRLTVRRLDEILSRCGYALLDIEDDFDWFASEFLESRHPLDFLDEVIVGYARQQENSFLYRVYGSSVRYEDELLRVMIPRR